MRVLVTDVKYRKSFDVVNCLRRLGYQTLLTEGHSRHLLRLAYGQTIHRLQTDVYEEFEADLLRLLEQFPDEKLVYIPCEEHTTLLFLQFVEKTRDDRLRYCLPSSEAFGLARHKKKLSRFCGEKGFPCPRELSPKDIARLNEEFLPVVAKPSIGSGSAGVIFVESPEELDRLTGLGDDYLVQQRLPEARAVRGAFFLFDRGKCVGYYGHRRIRTYPMSGGVTVYSEIEFDDAIKAAGCRLLEALDWHGLAMVEFLYGPDAKVPHIIEVNPRLWGSMLLSEYSNSGFLDNYVRMALGKSLKPYVPRDDVSIRWLFPFDFLNLLASRGRIPGFWRLARSQTCYIGFTYSTWLRSLGFLACNLLDLRRIRKFTGKLRASCA